MAVTTAQQLAEYYEKYKTSEVVFTKEVVCTLNLDPRQVYIKCGGAHWPCILNSTSLSTAKIIVGRKGGAFAALESRPSVSLRLCFTPQDAQIISFFVNAKVTGIEPYMETEDLVIITLTFSQRAPDDLIAIMGGLLEANINAVKRREERIAITPDSKRRLGIESEEMVVFLQNVPRHCIVRDVSFSGAKIIMVGTHDMVFKKVIVLRFDFVDPRESIYVKGLVVAATAIEDRNDLIVANILFDEKSLPMTYKMHINDYIITVRKSQLSHNEAVESTAENGEEASE